MLVGEPANEVVFEAGTVLFLGSNFICWSTKRKNIEKFIQVDIDPYKLGSIHALDMSSGDAGQAAKAILDKVNQLVYSMVACKREEQQTGVITALSSKVKLRWNRSVPSLQYMLMLLRCVSIERR